MNRDVVSTSGISKVNSNAVPDEDLELFNNKSGSVRQAVVVLAMHRTGSSAITRVLNLLGCDTPSTLIGPNAYNESGHWESDVLRVFNDKLLASAGSDWRDWQSFNQGWYQTPRFTEYLEHGLELLKSEYGTSGFFVFKDPRVARIMPFWRQILAVAKVKPYVVMTLRHPSEVAASLANRDGMTETEAVLIWLRNTLEAEHGSRGMRRVLVNYDRLMMAPSATMIAIQKPLGLFWPRLTEKVAAEIDSFISPKLRHHKAGKGFATVHAFRDWLIQVYGIFERWSEMGEDQADWPALDAVRMTMDNLAAPLREIVSTLNQKTIDIAAQNKELAYLRGEAGKRGDAVTALTAEKKKIIESFEKEKAEHAHATLAEMVALQDELKAARKITADQAEAHQAAFAAYTQELTYLRDEAGKHSDVVTALTTEQTTALAEAEELRSKLADLLKKNLSQSDLLSQTAALKLEQDQSHLAQITAVKSELEVSRAALDESRAIQKNLEGKLSETQSALLQRQLETEETAAALKLAQQKLEVAEKSLDQSQKAQIEEQATSEAACLAAEIARRTAEERCDEIVNLTKALMKHDKVIEAQATHISTIENAAEALRQKLDETSIALSQNQQKIADQTQALNMHETTIQHSTHLARESRLLSDRIDQAINVVLARPERPWLSHKRKLARKAALLCETGMFDTEWYNNAYPDVAQSAQDPISHYILYGRAEGRHPLPNLARVMDALSKRNAAEN